VLARGLGQRLQPRAGARVVLAADVGNALAKSGDVALELHFNHHGDEKLAVGLEGPSGGRASSSNSALVVLGEAVGVLDQVARVADVLLPIADVEPPAGALRSPKAVLEEAALASTLASARRTSELPREEALDGATDHGGVTGSGIEEEVSDVAHDGDVDAEFVPQLCAARGRRQGRCDL
jgi:hypothetical protein